MILSNETRTMQVRTYYPIYSLLLTAFALCYYHTFFWLHYKYSQQDSYYSHGYLIPIITIYLIYRKRTELRVINRSSDISGLAIIICALLLHIIGTMSDVNFFSGFSMFFYVFGASLYLFGRDLTKQIAFPLVFLVFMFPIPNPFIDTVGLPSKSLATSLALKIIDLIGIPYFQEGFKINLGNTSLFVGTPCNGMKSLISFAALAALFLHLSDVALWRRLAIFAAIFPMAFFLNACRIAILVYIANNYGIEKASPESYLHSMSGLAVFIVGTIALVLFVRISEQKTS